MGWMGALRRLTVVLLAMITISGCAQKTDWIGGTLVTVDVTGVWRGNASPHQHQRGVQAEVEMSLTQRGPKVTGEGRFRTTKVKLEGTVRGDVFSFSDPGGFVRGDATVTGGEMSGPGWSRATGGEFTLKLSRQP